MSFINNCICGNLQIPRPSHKKLLVPLSSILRRFCFQLYKTRNRLNTSSPNNDSMVKRASYWTREVHVRRLNGDMRGRSVRKTVHSKRTTLKNKSGHERHEIFRYCMIPNGYLVYSKRVRQRIRVLLVAKERWHFPHRPSRNPIEIVGPIFSARPTEKRATLLHCILKCNYTCLREN